MLELPNKSILGSEHGAKRKRGLHNALHGGVFKPSDIERNSVLSYIHDSNKKLGSGFISPQVKNEDLRSGDMMAFVKRKRNSQLTGDNSFGKRHYSTIEDINAHTRR